MLALESEMYDTRPAHRSQNLSNFNKVINAVIIRVQECQETRMDGKSGITNEGP